VLVAMSRIGSQVFWRAQAWPTADAPPPPRPLEVAAAIVLLAYGIALTLGAGPALRYAHDAGAQILAPAHYIEQVRDTQPLLRAPSP